MITYTKKTKTKSALVDLPQRETNVFLLLFFLCVEIKNRRPIAETNQRKKARVRERSDFDQWVTRFQQTGMMICCNIFYILPGLTGETWELIDCTFTPDIATNHSTTVHLIKIDRKLEYLITAGRKENSVLFCFVLFVFQISSVWLLMV